MYAGNNKKKMVILGVALGGAALAWVILRWKRQSSRQNQESSSKFQYNSNNYILQYSCDGDSIIQIGDMVSTGLFGSNGSFSDHMIREASVHVMCLGVDAYKIIGPSSKTKKIHYIYSKAPSPIFVPADILHIKNFIMIFCSRFMIFVMCIFTTVTVLNCSGTVSGCYTSSCTRCVTESLQEARVACPLKMDVFIT